MPDENGYVPRRETVIDADWLAREHERLAREQAEWERAQNEIEIVNGATRAIDGTFAMLPHRLFRVDGRTERAATEFGDLLRSAIARSCGWSWRALGETLGVSASALHRRFARNTPEPRLRRPRA
jgi:hypothetical protein